MAYNAMGLANGDGSVTVYGNSSSSGGGGGTTASAVSYDNSTSGLSATNVQEAIDVLATSSAGGSVVNIITDTDWFHGKVVTLTGTYDTYQATFDNNGHAQVRVFYNDTYDVECEDFHNSLIVTEMGAVYTVGIDEDYAIVTITAYDTDEMKNKSIIIKLGDIVKATPTFDDNGVLTFKATKVDTYTIYYTDENDVTRLPQNFKVKELNITMSITYYHIIPKTFAAATDSEVIVMVMAADEGYCDLYDDCGWRVGQERTVHLSAMSATGVGESHVAQDVTFVLMNKGGKTLTNAVSSGRTECSFVVGMKDCLNEVGYMNSTGTNNGSWSSSARRAWCNSVFKNAIPSTLLPIFKQFQNITAQTYNGSTNQTTDDYFALPAAAEVFKGDPTYGTGGSAGKTTAYSNLTEFNALSRFTYYETTANRVKTVNGSANYWWERSPNYNASAFFCSVNNDGGAANDNASYANGLAPFGVI